MEKNFEIVTLTPSHVSVLENQGNRCTDWSSVSMYCCLAQTEMEHRTEYIGVSHVTEALLYFDSDSVRSCSHPPGVSSGVEKAGVEAEAEEGKLDMINRAIFEVLTNIWRCNFAGDVRIEVPFGLGAYNSTCPSTTSSKCSVIGGCGLFDSSFEGLCYISSYCTIKSCDLVKDAFIGKSAFLQRCGVISGRSCVEGSKLQSFGHATSIAIGPESNSGGRSRFVTILPTLSYVDVCYQVFRRKRPSNDSKNHQQAASVYCGVSIIGNHCTLSRCSNITDCYFAAGVTIQDSCMESCIVLSRGQSSNSSCNSSTNSSSSCSSRMTTTSISHGSLKGCLLHADSCVEGGISGHGAYGCTLVSSVLFPGSSVHGGAYVLESVLAPGSSVSQGECLHSLLGPAVGFHHPALLISTTWALGKGNIAANALIGANHSGRLADQECLVGEGLFLGLAVRVRFPCCFLEAPYSLVSAGTELPPQRLAFPFSLVCPDMKDSSINIVKPGWMLYNNSYYIERKLGLIRPYIVNSVLSARRRLYDCLERVRMTPSSSSPLSAATGTRRVDREFDPGFGLCSCTVLDIERAVLAYTNFIRRYALRALLLVLIDKSALHIFRTVLLSCCPSPAGSITSGNHFDAQNNQEEDEKQKGKEEIIIDPIQAMLDDIQDSADAQSSRASFFCSDISDKVKISPLTDEVLKHQCHLIYSEFPEFLDCFKDLLTELDVGKKSSQDSISIPAALSPLFILIKELEAQYSCSVAQCKDRDIVKCAEIIPDWDTFSSASTISLIEDPTVAMARRRCDMLTSELDTYMMRFK